MLHARPTRRLIPVILNSSSGPDRKSSRSDEIRDAFLTAGIEADLVPVDNPSDISASARDLISRGSDTVVAAGGDGTVSAVGAALVGTDAALGVIPAGTFNPFARDVGLPLDLESAAAVIAAGHTRTVDVGELNGRVFLNNSSLGVYPVLVYEREKFVRRGLDKRLALLPAAIATLSRFPNLTVRVRSDVVAIAARTPFVFVGNNEYALAGLQAASRSSIDRGRLQLCVTAQLRPGGLLRLALLALIGRIHTASDLHTTVATWVRVDTLRHRVRVALDGEVLLMETPLNYTIRPAALRVLTPEPA